MRINACFSLTSLLHAHYRCLYGNTQPATLGYERVSPAWQIPGIFPFEINPEALWFTKTILLD